MKFILEVTDKHYVVSTEQLQAVYDILDDCERYQKKWSRAENGGEAFYTHHVYECDAEDTVRDTKTMSSAMYAVCKLAGRPER